MAHIDRVGAILLHPDGNSMGNLRWPGDLPTKLVAVMPAALALVRQRGYFASAFPEGDGITFKRQDGTSYEPTAGLADFRECFPFLAIAPLDEDERLTSALVRLAHGRTTSCRYLVPVEGLRLHEPIQFGQTKLHPRVDGVDVQLADHAWRELCEVPAADVIAGWAPDARASGTTRLLGHTLIERTAEVPLDALYAANGSVDGTSRLLRFLIEDADRALDPVRFSLCHYRRLEYLPAKPGWLNDFALAYVMPNTRAVPARLIVGKPYVLRVSNNWLGLEADTAAVSGVAGQLATVVDSNASDPITLALKSALRAWNRSFYLVELEASFLHLVYAIDALCEPGDLRGERHRLWIGAFVCGGDAQRFGALLDKFDKHYSVRNKIVHGGEAFSSLGLFGEEQCQFMLQLLSLCINVFLQKGFKTRREAKEYAFRLLTSPAFSPIITAKNWQQLKLPLIINKEFKKHMQL